MSFLAPLTDRLPLLAPLLFLFYSLVFLPPTIFSLLLTPRKLLSYPAFQRAWFSRFWSWLGPQVRESNAPAVEPLVAAASGVVLDIGPGTGQWLYLYSPKRNTKITKIYGVEPNVGHHAALRRAITAAGLEGVYEVVGVGAEELHLAGLERGSVDTVVTIMVLCSIPDPKRVIREVYGYLKPGGTWIVYEHVRTRLEKEFVGWWQKALDPMWRACYDGCSLIRPTEEYLKDAGSWSKIDLRPLADEGIYDPVPHAMGHLIK